MEKWETYSDGVGQVEMAFMNKNKNTVELVIKKEEFEYQEGLKQEEVRIGDLEGLFIPYFHVRERHSFRQLDCHRQLFPF